MKTSSIITASLLGLAVTLPGAAAPLLPPRASDHVPSRLQAAPAPGMPLEEAPLAFAWQLDPQRPVTAPLPHIAISRGYWLTVDGSALRSGLPLPLSAPDALILVSPARHARALAPDAVQLHSEAGAAVAVSATGAAALRGIGMPVGEGTVTLRTGDGHAAGSFQLRAPQAAGQYVVQVQEPNSDLRLEVQADRLQGLAGEHITVRAQMAADGVEGLRRARSALQKGAALLVRPDGRSWSYPMQRADDGTLAATLPLPGEVGDVAGLWELQVFAEAGSALRDGKVAFSVARPTARFSGQARTVAGTRSVSLPVRAAAAGRYAASGTLFATARDGALRPVAQAQAAAWTPGAGGLVLELPFDQVPLPAGYGAPFELRHLLLQDQGRLAPVETRERALAFD